MQGIAGRNPILHRKSRSEITQGAVEGLEKLGSNPRIFVARGRGKDINATGEAILLLGATRRELSLAERFFLDPLLDRIITSGRCVKKRRTSWNWIWRGL
jgi:hypothetical protein